MTTPAENAATVREAVSLLASWAVDAAGMSTHDESAALDRITDALAALLAQAEAAEILQDKLDVEREVHAEVASERDAAVRAAEQAQRQLDAVDDNLRPWEAPPDSETGVVGRVQTILNLKADRRAAEHAQEALRIMAVDFAPDLKIHDPEILATEYMHRAALTRGVDDPCDDTHRFAHGLNHPCNCGEHETWAAWAALTGEGTDSPSVHASGCRCISCLEYEAAVREGPS